MKILKSFIFILGALAFLFNSYWQVEAAAPNKNADLLFLNRMIGNQINCLNLAEEGLKKAQCPELKKLIQEISDLQNKQLEKVRKLRKDLYGEKIVVHDPASLKDQHECCHLEQEKFTDFDQEFIHKMIKHQQQCLTLAQEEGLKSQRTEIKKLAQEIIDNLSPKVQAIQGGQKCRR